MATLEFLDAVVARLKRYDSVRVVRTADAVQIPAVKSDGFDIKVEARKDGWTVAFESWRREVDDLETAWNVIALGLSTGARLRLEPMPDGRTQCWLEIVLPDGSWRTLPEIGREPNRSNPAVRYRQNGYLKTSYRRPDPVRVSDRIGPRVEDAITLPA